MLDHKITFREEGDQDGDVEAEEDEAEDDESSVDGHVARHAFLQKCKEEVDAAVDSDSEELAADNAEEDDEAGAQEDASSAYADAESSFYDLYTQCGFKAGARRGGCKISLYKKNARGGLACVNVQLGLSAYLKARTKLVFGLATATVKALHGEAVVKKWIESLGCVLRFDWAARSIEAGLALWFGSVQNVDLELSERIAGAEPGAHLISSANQLDKAVGNCFEYYAQHPVFPGQLV